MFLNSYPLSNDARDCRTYGGIDTKCPLSFVAHRFGRIEFRTFVLIFSTALSCRKKNRFYKTSSCVNFLSQEHKKGKIIDAIFLSDVRRSASRSHLDSRVHICLRAMGFKIVGNRKEKRTPSWESTRLFLKSRRAEVEGAGVTRVCGVGFCGQCYHCDQFSYKKDLNY